MNTLKYYTSDNGIYVSKVENYPRLDATNWTINGKKLSPTHKSKWWFVAGDLSIQSVQKLSSRNPINFRWELNSGVADAIKELTPQVISQADAFEYNEEDCGWTIGDLCEHSGFKTLYRRVNDYSTPEFESVEFNFELLGHIESVLAKTPNTPKFEYYRTRYISDGVKSVDLRDIITYSELNEMLVPELLIHNTPCVIDSATTFKIIRHYVMNNIDLRVSSITSNYDFCFTVRKKISVAPYIHKWEEKKRNGKSYNRPRTSSKTISNKLETVFEMAPGPKGYDGYTIIKGFKGENLSDLVENIKLYLDELMWHINRPAKQCECCKGSGEIIGGQFEINER